MVEQKQTNKKLSKKVKIIIISATIAAMLAFTAYICLKENYRIDYYDFPNDTAYFIRAKGAYIEVEKRHITDCSKGLGCDTAHEETYLVANQSRYSDMFKYSFTGAHENKVEVWQYEDDFSLSDQTVDISYSEIAAIKEIINSRN